MGFNGWRPLLALAGALILPAAAQAQEGFRFREPEVQFSLRVGAAMPRASGELFDQMRQRLTLGTRDFAAENLSAEVLFRAAPSMDVGLGFDWEQSTARSEFRYFTYDDAQSTPIQQVTKLRRSPLSALVRFYPLGRGESLARYAWVPKRFTPFLGGGAGIMWYRLQQQGDFVNEVTYDIFPNTYRTNGSALAMHVLAGSDYWVTPAVGISAEGRYTFASGQPGSDFAYSSIDLSGLQLTAGLSFRF